MIAIQPDYISNNNGILVQDTELRLPNRGTGLYVPEDISFVNTSELTEVGRYYLKNKDKDGTFRYCPAPEGSPDYVAFWDREEDRLTNGMTIPGQLVRNDKGEIKCKEVHISGTHYGFMNYALMKRIPRIGDDTDEMGDMLRMTKQSIKAATKIHAFGDFWDGHYHFETAKNYARSIGLHLVGAKARRKGFSYFEAFDLALTVNMIPYAVAIAAAYQMDFLVGGNRIMNMAKSYLDHFETYTDFGRGYLKYDLEDEIKLGFKPYGTKVEDGYRSILRAISFKDRAEPGRGIDGIKLKFEECQSFPNLLKVIKAMLPILEAGAYITGQMVLWGTGGDTEKPSNWDAFMSIFFNPNEYKCLAYKDIYGDESIDDFLGCGMFYPYWQNLEPFLDKEGNTMKKEAMEYAVVEDAEQKKISKKVSEYLGWKAERAMKPSDVFIETSSDFFPDVSDQLNRLKYDTILQNIGKHGWVEYDDKEKLIFTESKSVQPINEYPIKGLTNLKGCMTIYFKPWKDANGNIPDGLYRVWNDPFGLDIDEKNITTQQSMGVTYVYEMPNTFTPTKGGHIVAKYIGRPATMAIYDLNMFKLAAFYNAKILFENDRGDVKNNAKRAGVLGMLEPEPNINWDKNLAKKHGRGYGISMSDPKRKEAGLTKLNEWLDQPIGSGENGDIMRNYHRIYCGYLLEQIKRFSFKKNLDAVSCLVVGMFDMEERRLMPIRVAKPAEQVKQSLFTRRLFE